MERKKNNTQWFDEKCFTAKQEFKTARNAFIKNKKLEYIFVKCELNIIELKKGKI